MGKKKRGNGEGTIYWSETLQKYVAQYVDNTGKRKTLTQRKNEKNSEFKARFVKVMNDLNQNTYVEPRKRNFYYNNRRFYKTKVN